MENMKLKQARDSVLAYMLAQDFTKEEIKTVLQMCNDEVDAWDKRSKLVEARKDDKPYGKE